MLPDFAEIKKKIRAQFDQELDTKVMRDPLISQVKRIECPEGNSLAICREDGTTEVTQLRSVEARFSVTRSAVKELGIHAYLERQPDVARSISGQQSKNLISEMESVVQKTGNIIDGKGQPFDFDLYLEGLRMVPIDFDDDGKPLLPHLVTSPALKNRISDEIATRLRDPAGRAKFERLIEDKRQEFHDRQSNRKLVD